MAKGLKPLQFAPGPAINVDTYLSQLPVPIKPRSRHHKVTALQFVLTILACDAISESHVAHLFLVSWQCFHAKSRLSTDLL